ncbi:hypothetical protein GLOIN_2v1734289 [Rhizophagus irregularis DAOM 181602=DAOM 197198]|uniref:SAM domain-containing protein n=1 Tax=Rhizophagus irregularis (strain DAOM 181602 / DAOM 197198 / MUCL 43194) TaxID=747089 RepID=A0A2P4NY08_RHIID|nr:hypothetical protein GLOIN_2v1734289 [Rhizophagus irregularis DAOM 181602=DAOM 197198]POG58031.1 hypothetical protein GLOIN_2v1734289 [Rhizophagus irregularis DAOM 181602=DAOM 197198]|eukprot:XP_025164897.1 hypothetical protein GLOIN_2v1734289 [Rhizophagus irregularis DAOM 181602=DAOM 197198]
MSSETSTPYTPASTSTTVAGNETVSLADEIKKYDTVKLIEFLQGHDLEEEEIDGRAFLKMTEQRFRDYGMKGGPAVKLVEFAKECKDKKLRSFSSYKTKKELSEVLEKYGIVSGDITRIPQFIPPIHTINESAPEFKLCIDDILRRIKNMGPVVDSNEAMRCEYISTILHTARDAGGNNLHNRRQTESSNYRYLPKLTTMPKCLRYEYKYEQEKKKGG